MTKHSWVVLSQADGRPLYLQIIEQVRQRVAIGDLRPSEEIPSIRQLASDLSVSVITVKRAYLELERDGVIITRQGKGSFIADNPNLQPQVQLEELEALVAKTARLAATLGVSKSQLQKQIAAAVDLANGGSQ